MSFIYEVPVDPDAENNCHSFALSFIGYNKSVLEVGCSTGYFTKAMVARGCNVVGLELDADAAERAEEWAERVVVGDLNDEEIWGYVKDESFDVVVLGDVLEHLLDPLESLRHAVRKLKPSGFVVTSLPNIADGDIRMSLLLGRFQYREVGLLDRTHIHFFTLESMRDLMKQAGLVVTDTKRVVVPLFHSEIGVRRDEINPTTLDELLSDPEVESYQFVTKAVRDNGTRTLSELSQKLSDLSDRAQREDVRTALLRAEIYDAQLTTAELERTRGYLKEHQEYIEAIQGHVSGLEHNIEVLNAALVASEERYQALLRSKSGGITDFIRRAQRKLSRTNGRRPGGA